LFLQEQIKDHHQMVAKQRADFQQQMREMEIRQQREMAKLQQNKQIAQSSAANVVHPLSPNEY
jgi:predicted  nucleic acid-binding Zn-ribbon protein